MAYSARLFGPAYLEIFTKTQWYVVPLVWLPIAAYLFLRSATQFTAPQPPVTFSNFFQTIPTLSTLSQVSTRAWTLALASFFFGNFIWTLLEYGFHRFLFHVDRLLPDRPIFLVIHFLTHGIHHYLPMDRLAFFIYVSWIKAYHSVQIEIGDASSTFLFALFPNDTPRLSGLPSSYGEWCHFRRLHVLCVVLLLLIPC